MRLHPAGIEYYALSISTDPATTATDWSASFDDGETWTTAQDIDGRSAWLLAGPDADDPGAAILLPTGAVHPIVRHIDSPEVIIRSTPSIVVG